MPKEINRWAMYPRKTSSSPLPEALKMEVITKANELIETVLKPRYIQPPPENPQFNYILVSTAAKVEEQRWTEEVSTALPSYSQFSVL